MKTRYLLSLIVLASVSITVSAQELLNRLDAPVKVAAEAEIGLVN